MAQLNDLLVAGAARLLNGLGILGTTNSDSILPNKTDTYVLGESGKRWNSAHIKTITGSHITLDTLTVNNYATIGGGQAATAKNTGALRVKGGLSTEQQSFFSGGAIFSGAADSSTRLYVFGDKTAQHISMGDAGIQAYSNNTPTPSKLYLQYNGGDLDIGKSGHTGVTTIYGPLNYAGFSAASDNADRVVWFSYNGTIGRPVYDNDFKYNPNTNRLTLGRLYLTNTEGVTHIQFSRANYNYVIAPTGGSIAFGANGATGGSQVSLVISASDVVPGQNNGTIELGSPDYAWKSLYTRNVYWDDGNGKQNAYTSYTNGTASTTEGTAGAQGYFNLFLGNSTAVSTTAGSGAGNSRGRLYIYGTGAYSSLIQTQAASSSKTVTIPNYTGYMVIGNDGYSNPTEATTYYMPFYLTTHKRLSANDGFRYTTLEGTASAAGYGGIYLGNGTASGTAGNKYGFLRIYASNANYTSILSQGNGNRNFYLGNYAGNMYAVHTGDNNAVGAGDKPVYIAANGRATAFSSTIGGSTRPVYINAGTITPITAVGTAYGGTGNTSFTANRLVWTESATKMTAANHYASSSKVAINYTSAPNENFYVGGTSKFAGSVTITGNNTLFIGTQLKLWSDGEGGNIRLYTKTSTTNCFEFDTYDGNLRLYYCTDGGNGTTGYTAWSWGTNGVFQAPYIGVNGSSTSYRLYVNGGGYMNGLTLTNTNPITFYGNGTGNYNCSVIYVNSTGFTIETPRATDSGSAAILPLYARTRGGQYSTFKAGDIYSNDNLVLHAGNWSSYCAATSHTHTSVPIAGTDPVPAGSTDTTITWGNKGNNTTWWYDSSGTLTDKPSDWGFVWNLAMGNDVSQLWFTQSSGKMMRRSGNASGWATSWKQIWCQGDSVTGAVWNDYAECRESDTEDLGYVLMETGKDSLTKTTERLSHFAGVSSDTWGFSQGETEKAKTPIAVAGRVLVYPYQDRNNYKPGDCVCAAPGGTVDIMTREEVILWPDRIVGTVSQVPDYDEWGGGEVSDRDSVKVNGRIWIKVR